jgi:CheY-like chemotaxis protein
VEARHLASGMPSILLSSSVSGARELLDRGENPFAAVLAKPVKPRQLGETIVRVLHGRTPADRKEAARTDAPKLASSHPLRILLAEDNLVNQRVAVRLLERFGYRPDVAGSGLEVLAALRRQPYDVVLLDIQMPEMDGLEAARRIHQEFGGTGRPRLIALTANVLREDRDRCTAAGMDDFLAKPMRLADLEAALLRSERIPRSV